MKMIYNVEKLPKGEDDNSNFYAVVKGSKRVPGLTFTNLPEAMQTGMALNDAWMAGYELAVKLSKELYELPSD